MAFLYYYPRQKINLGDFELSWFCGYNLPIPQCQASYQKKMLESKEELFREFAIANTQCAIVGSGDDAEDAGSMSSAGLAGAAVAGALGAMML